jgi:hypothetical protein
MKRSVEMVNRTTGIVVGTALAIAVSFPMSGRADDKDKDKPVQVTVVNFGERPDAAAANKHVAIQTHIIHGPDDTDEITINKNGLVTFVVNGGGHAISVYPVSRNTKRQDISEDLCNDKDGNTDVVARSATCAGAATSNLRYLVTDGKHDLVIDTDTNPPTGHGLPARVYDPEHILLSVPGTPGGFPGNAGGFLNGSVLNANGTVSNRDTVGYKFTRTGRFLVICMNRNHSINDWMFAFITVVDDDDDK